MDRRLVWGAGVALALAWLDLFRQLSYQWQSSDQYSFGWMVPVLAGVLLLRRWPERPPASPGRSSGGLLGLWAIVGLMLLPIRLVYESNPEWPLISWVFSIGLIAWTLFAVYLAGGLKWVLHFGFPILFVLVAVRWPWRIEQGLTQGLMRAAAGLTVEALGILNIPAVRHGNLIEISTGTLGVEEACSGIRSFQSSLMAALYLGEHYLLRPSSRLVLVPVGLFLAFLLNIARTLFLGWNAAMNGISAVDRWHDSAGMTVLLAAFAGLWALTWWLKSRWEPRFRAEPLEGVENRTAEKAAWDKSYPFRPNRGWAVVLGCSAVVVFGNQLWFALPRESEPSPVRWTITLPKDAAEFRELPLSDRELQALGHDSSETAAWRDAEGVEWRFYYLQWSQGPVGTRVFARSHRPEVCLVATGRSLSEERGSRLFKVGDVELPFMGFVFNDHGKPLYVFHAVWDNSNWKLSRTTKRLPVRERVSLALAGTRRVEQRMVEIILSGAADANAAERAVASVLPSLIRGERVRPEPMSASLSGTRTDARILSESAPDRPAASRR